MEKRTKMKRPTFRKAIAWIAENDNVGSIQFLDINDIENYITVAIIADLFGYDDREVADLVVKYRQTLVGSK